MKTGTVTLMIALCLPVTVFATTLRLSTDIDLLVLDGKKSPVHSCAARTALSSIMGPINLFFGLRRQSASPAMQNSSTFPRRW